MEFKMNLFWLLMLVAGILAIAGVFLDWLSLWGNGVTGWDFFSDGTEYDGGFRYYMPVVSLVLGVLVLILALLELMDISVPISKIIVIVLGILVIIMPFITMSEFDGFMDYLGTGFWVEVVAGALMVVLPILSIMEILPDEL
ncbi:MAG: hypothetical protein FWH44_02780 [Methanomassiliicoccaceae archaeon]|nr:hypothetical protein [Methanomassiliicoccaceae archaeon]